MSDALTLVNQAFKGDVDPGLPVFVPGKLSARFPSYLTDFCKILQSLTFRMNAAFRKRLLRSEPKFPLATAFMAIV
jgi:hypothetical protein